MTPNVTHVTDVPHASTPWQRQILPRFFRLWWLKTSGTIAILVLFFAAYLHVLKHPASQPVTVPMLLIDDWIGFFPPALWVYASLWVYLSLAPSMLLGLRELLAFGIWITLLCCAGLLIFYFWPTQVTLSVVDHAQHWGFATLRGVDAGGNACPSLHVATAVFTFYWFDRVIRDMNMGMPGRFGNALWLIAIAWSTMAIKQHVAIDVAAGFALGTLFAAASLWGRRLVSWADYQQARQARQH